MKILLPFLFPLTFIWSATAQETFNKRMRFDFEAAVLTSVLPTDSCYYSTGIIADTVPPFNTGNIFVKFDLDGNPVTVKTIEGTEKTYETWENCLHAVDGGFMVAGYTLDSTIKILLIKYNEEGDTIFTKEYLNPYYPNAEFIIPKDFEVGQDKGLVLVNWVTSPTNGNTQVGILKLDSLGNLIYHKTYGNFLREIPFSLLIAPNGKIIAGARRGNENLVVQDYDYQAYIFQTDSLGNEEWAYLSDPANGLRDAANDMVLLDDGSLVVASGVGHEQVHGSGVNTVYYDKHIFKLNPQQEIEWELTFPDEELNGTSVTTTLIELSDGSGFVMAGAKLESNPAPGVNYTVRGWLAKVSPEGDSVWTRQHTYLDDTTNEHNIYDLKETPDGGLILCGESRDRAQGATYPQQGWLLKLDQHGCLVPGCHIIGAAEEGGPPEMELAIYPNPTTDYLNFQLRGKNVGQSASFRIIDAQGKTVREHEAGQAGDTYIVPVWEWAAGVYFLQYMGEGEVLVSERFVVSK